MSYTPPPYTGSTDDPKGTVERAYDTIAPKYHAWASPRPTETRKEYLTKLQTLLPTTGAKVLELGCGSGVPATQWMVEQGWDVTATDISAAQIELTQQHVPGAKYIKSDMMSLDVPAGSFDAVVSFYAMFHLPKAEQGLIIEKMTGWLKPGGWVLYNLGTKDEERWTDNWMGAPMFSTGNGIEGNREMLKKHGQGLNIVHDEIHIESVGGFEEKFHWVMAQKHKTE